MATAANSLNASSTLCRFGTAISSLQVEAQRFGFWRAHRGRFWRRVGDPVGLTKLLQRKRRRLHRVARLGGRGQRANAEETQRYQQDHDEAATEAVMAVPEGRPAPVFVTTED